jgi:hypothetical protein
MKYSDKLNGYWEEGYHYYVEIRDEKMTVRDYRRAVTLETTIEYDADQLERGERTVISPADNVLSRDGYGEPFTMIRELAWEDGELKFLYYYTIMGETLYTLKKVDRDPFDHIIIRDDEYLPQLQGEWLEWPRDRKYQGKLIINGNRLTMMGVEGRPIHVVSYKYDKDSVYIVPADLIHSDFGSYTQISVCPDMLTTHMMIFDASTPLSVFAREDMLDKIEVPGSAKGTIVNTMTHVSAPPMPGGPYPGLTGFMGMMRPGMMPGANAPQPRPEPDKPTEPKKEGPNFCPCCGYEVGPNHRKFCPECGSLLVSE